MQIDLGVLQSRKNKRIPYCMTLPNGEGPFPVLYVIPGFGDSFLTDQYLPEIQSRATAEGWATVTMIPSAYTIKNNKVETGRLTYNNFQRDIITVDKAIKRHPALDPDKCVVAAASLGANQTLNLMSEGYPGFHAAVLYSLVPKLLADKLLAQITPSMERLWSIKQLTGSGHKCLVDSQIREFHFKLYDQAKRLNLFEKAKQVTRPVTIINGTADKLAPVADIRRIADNMQRCDHLSVNFIDNAGHCFKMQPKDGETISEFDWAFQLTKETLAKLAPEASNVPLETQPVFASLASVQKPVRQQKTLFQKCLSKLESFTQIHTPHVLVADDVLRGPLHKNLAPM